MSKKLIVANWKMAPETLGEARGILEAVDGFLGSLAALPSFSLVVCPPFVFIEEVAKILGIGHLAQNAFLGAQDIAPQETGALTGEVSGPMLDRLGVRYVIIGHSERRWKLGETDDVVNTKLRTALQHGFTPLVCLGERTRDGQFAEFLREQTRNTFAGLDAGEIEKCIVAYEPVWAISSNPGARPDTPESANESIHIVHEVLAGEGRSVKSYLYGGSVNSRNVADFISQPDIGGVLVGSASVQKEEFVKILQAVELS